MAKVTIVGAGQTGATTAHWLAQMEIADLVLVDVVQGVPQGKGLDLAEGLPIIGSDVNVIGSNDYAETAGSDIVVITAGLACKPGMSRVDPPAAKRPPSPGGRELAGRLARGDAADGGQPARSDGLPGAESRPSSARARHGQAGVLDMARMRCFIAIEMGISVEDVTVRCSAGTGIYGAAPASLERRRGPVARLTAGRPAGGYRRADRQAGPNRLAAQDRQRLLCPGRAATQMVAAILRDRHLILPAAAYLQGEYGLNDLFFGVPVQLGRGGLERVIEYELQPDERQALEQSAARVRVLIEAEAWLRHAS